MDFALFKSRLEKAGVLFAPGLTEQEIQHIESTYSVKFPPDLQEFLAYALPINQNWVNWREANREEIEQRLLWPYEGMCFDIEHNVFWLPEWGEKPSSLEEAFAVAKSAVDNAPKLIPLCSHRYIPDSPHLEGNPVFSVYQTDIIYYGTDLQNYIMNEYGYYFRGMTGSRLEEEIRLIEFWSKLVELN